MNNNLKYFNQKIDESVKFLNVCSLFNEKNKCKVIRKALKRKMLNFMSKKNSLGRKIFLLYEIDDF